MKAFKQLISLLCKDPRHQSWCLTVQAGIWLVPATWGISNQAGADREKFHCLRTPCGRSRWSWTWAHSCLKATRSAWWFWCVFGKAQLWFWLGLQCHSHVWLLPKFSSVAFAEPTCRLVMLTSASTVRRRIKFWDMRRKGVHSPGLWPSVLGKLSSCIYICWRDTCVQMSWLSHTQLNPMYEV